MKFVGAKDLEMRAALERAYAEAKAEILGRYEGTESGLKLQEYFAKLDAELVVNLNEKMKSTAGRAWCQKHKVDMHYRLFKKNPSDMRNTFVHELAHLVAWNVFKDRGHGLLWKTTMLHMGEKPTRCHSLDVSEWKRPQRRNVWTCGCTDHAVKQGMHNRMMKMVKHYGESYRTCRLCKNSLTYTGTKEPTPPRAEPRQQPAAEPVAAQGEAK